MRTSRRLILLAGALLPAAIAIAVTAAESPSRPAARTKAALPTQPATRPGAPPTTRPAVKLPRILDSINHPGRPHKLHPTRHMRRALTSTGWQMTHSRGYDTWAALARRHDAVMIADQEVLPANDGSGYGASGFPTGLEPEAEFQRLVGHQVWGLQQLRARLGPEWPIGAYALLPKTSYYVPLRHTAFKDASLDGTPGAWLRDPNHPEVKLYAINGYADWQKGNDRIAAAVLPHVDFVCPQVYDFGDDLKVWDWLLKGNVAEARRVAAGKPVYPFITPAYFEVDKNPKAGHKIKYATFKHWLRSTLAHADGVVVWGFTAERWNEKAEWLRALRDVCDELDAAP